MAEARVLRRIGDPVVAVAPAGARIRTRIRLTEDEAEALTAIGRFLGSVYRGELAERIRCGVLDRDGQAAWRARRKQALTAVASSRWAGAITRAVQDQFQLGMRALAAHVGDLRAAVGVLEARCALRPGERELVDDNEAGRRGRGSRRPRRGYRSAGERFGKTRRLAVLRARLADAESAPAAGHPSIAVGGKRLWRTRNHLDAAEMSEQQWRNQWNANRMFFTADGESGKAGGNETIRVDTDGRLRIKTPAALAERFGSHVGIEAPIQFSHRGGEWAARVNARRAVRYDISYDPIRDRWYLDASWHTDPEPGPDLADLRSGPVLGVDLNVGHLAVCVLDASGNPVGEPHTIEVVTAGLAATRRDGRVRAAITALLDYAQHTGCTAIVVENLDFRRRPGHRPRNPGTRHMGKTLAPQHRLDPHPPVPGSADRHGDPPRLGGHRGGPGLHQSLGQPALDHTVTAADFRSGHRHRPSWGGGRDRQTWPRFGDQATAGRTPHPTADGCGHTTGQARSSPQPRWQARQFRPTDTPAMRRAGPPENTRHQRPRPFGPHRTHSCSVIRNGAS